MPQLRRHVRSFARRALTADGAWTPTLAASLRTWRATVSSTLTAVALRTKPRAGPVSMRAARYAAVGRAVETETTRLRTRGHGADVAVFHEFVPPPARRRPPVPRWPRRRAAAARAPVEVNRISGSTPVCLFNSFNFDARAPAPLHARRIAGWCTASTARSASTAGSTTAPTGRIVALNHALADATVFQSRCRLEMHRELGFELRDPVVIRNAPDPALFHEQGRAALPASGADQADHKNELVRQPEEGRRRARRSRRAARSRALHAHLHRPHTGRASCTRPFYRRRHRRRGRAAAARASRVRLREPERGMLERVARGARVRPAGAVRRQRLERRGGRRRRDHVHGCRRCRRQGSTRSLRAGPSCGRR